MERLDDFETEGVERALRDLLAPVDEQIAALDDLIQRHEKRLRELRDVRTRAKKVRSALDPSPNGGSPQKDQTKARLARGVADREKKQRVEKFVRAHPGEDLIANSMEKQLEGISNAKVSELLDQLSAEGVVRFDRIIKGGGRAFRLVE